MSPGLSSAGLQAPLLPHTPMRATITRMHACPHTHMHAHTHIHIHIHTHTPVTQPCVLYANTVERVTACPGEVFNRRDSTVEVHYHIRGSVPDHRVAQCAAPDLNGWLNLYGENNTWAKCMVRRQSQACAAPAMLRYARVHAAHTPKAVTYAGNITAPYYTSMLPRKQHQSDSPQLHPSDLSSLGVVPGDCS